MAYGWPFSHFRVLFLAHNPTTEGIGGKIHMSGNVEKKEDGPTQKKKHADKRQQSETMTADNCLFVGQW